MASLPEDSRPDGRRDKVYRRPRRGCSFILGLFLLLFVAGIAAMALFSPFSIKDSLPILGNAIGLVRIDSTIMSAEEAVESLKKHEESSHIRGVLVRIDSPGGAVGASQEIYDAIRRVSRSKRVYASMGNTAASGGYYVASAADRIFANPGTVTGSIGVIFELTNWEDLVDKVGLKFDAIKSGKYKDIGSPNRPISPAERKILQGLIDDAYDQFVEAILDNRSKPLGLALSLQRTKGRSALGEETPTTGTLTDYVHQIADGRLYSGRQAKELGLVDDLGSMEDALAALGKEVGLEGEPKVVEFRRKMSLFDALAAKAGLPLPRSRGGSARLAYEMSVD